MKYFKKYPIFFIAMFVLIALFIAGAAYDVMLYNNDTASLGKLNSVMRQYDDVLATDPTQPSIDASAKNIKELEKHLADLESIYSSLLRPKRVSSCASSCAVW